MQPKENGMKLSERVTVNRAPALDGRLHGGAHGSDYLNIIAAGHAPRVVSQTAGFAEAIAASGRSRIFVSRLQLAARIGVHEWEKLDLQPIIVDLEFGLPSEVACHTDNIDDAVDYSEVVATLKHLATVRHYELVEAMAETMAAAIQREFGVPWLLLRLSKLAPFPGAEVGIVVERGRRA
jgi:dihydroneopterin aldolase